MRLNNMLSAARRRVLEEGVPCPSCCTRGRASTHPRTALVHGATRLTYFRLDRRMAAAGLRLRGAGPGKRVVVQLPALPED
ncbi:hypothetical protein FB563_4376 [Streptomyces puniciscabiei]|uniref:Uncharacterized protein n=1 Tax=Streptomyces puniciscabiei TaxID=164348 RepID=A0A542UJR6_9ACTN|nr:hypothetical protein FB563_4376 [Streptomyces puniciscabiei]